MIRPGRAVPGGGGRGGRRGPRGLRRGSGPRGTPSARVGRVVGQRGRAVRRRCRRRACGVRGGLLAVPPCVGAATLEVRHAPVGYVVTSLKEASWTCCDIIEGGRSGE